MTFTTLINELGSFYEITLYFKKGNKQVTKVTFIDSLKIIPFSVKDIAKAFNLEEQKGEIDYKAYREKGHILTKEEREYIKNDVVIVAKALNVLFNQKLDRMTIGSNALHEYKHILGKSRFEHFFPKINKEIDEDLRSAYRRWLHLLKSKIQRERCG